ncbi:MAG: HAMP domain-containing protein [Melioribacteraceae bacterium]|jgi:two-component sensor histidine kinase|nr:HAMP domain-containing protein [Melioribacteraceae bacterium]
MNILRLKKIWHKISFFLWGTIVFTLLVFSVLLIPFTNTIFEEKLSSEAENIIAAINPSLNSSIVTDDYADFLEFTLNLLPKNRYYEYMVLTKKNGFSIIMTGSNWKIDTLKGHWANNEKLNRIGMMTSNEFHEGEVFNFSSKVEFPGIDWGMINIGLNTIEYNDNKNKIMGFAVILGLVTAVLTLLLAILFGKRLARPILELTNASREVAKGNYNVKCNINTGDEIELLAQTFNNMTEQIDNSHAILEEKVKDRTENLEEINKALESEIEVRKTAEGKVQSSLEEKITLLQEIHHRVTNNLQIISSLLYLQISKSNNEDIIQVLRDSQNRVKTMGLVHEKLYKSENLAEIEFDEYIRDLSNYVSNSYDKKEIKIIYDLEKRYLSISSSVPCGLIINELISNVMKYAFPDEVVHSNPQLNISLKFSDNNTYTLAIRDNGIGLPSELEIENIDSLGLKLVQNLVNQLDGNLEIINTNGTEFVITFKEIENREEV